MKAWYKNGAKRIAGWRKDKDTVSKYYPADSTLVFKGLYKETAREWYDNGKLKLETFTKDNLQIINYYNKQGERTRQWVVKVIRPDGYDTIAYKVEMEPSGKKYTENLRSDPMPNYLLEE